MHKPEEIRAIIEAVLFTAREPVTLPHLEKLLEAACAAEEIRHHLARLQEKYGGEGGVSDATGVLLAEVAGGWQLLTHESTEPWVKQFISQNNIRKLSPAALEVLAIIAYRQPVTIAEINEIRGVESGGVIRTLLEKRIVRMAGRKNVVGKPILYGTGPEFLGHFGLASLEDLPSLTEFEKLFGGEAKQALLFEEPGVAARAGTADETQPFDESALPGGADAEAAAAADESTNRPAPPEESTQSSANPDAE